MSSRSGSKPKSWRATLQSLACDEPKHSNAVRAAEVVPGVVAVSVGGGDGRAGRRLRQHRTRERDGAPLERAEDVGNRITSGHDSGSVRRALTRAAGSAIWQT